MLYFVIFGMLFGPAASVIIYNAHEELYTTASQLLLGVPKGHYLSITGPTCHPNILILGSKCTRLRRAIPLFP